MSVIKSQSFRYANGSDMENFAHSLLMSRACSGVDALTLWHLSDFCLSFLMHTWAVEASSRQESRCCSGCPQKRSWTFPNERHDSKMGHFSNTSLARSPQGFLRPRLTTGCYSWLLYTATLWTGVDETVVGVETRLHITPRYFAPHRLMTLSVNNIHKWRACVQNQIFKKSCKRLGWRMRTMHIEFRRRQRHHITTINMAANMRLGLRQLLRAKNTAHFRFYSAMILYTAPIFLTKWRVIN